MSKYHIRTGFLCFWHSIAIACMHRGLCMCQACKILITLVGGCEKNRSNNYHPLISNQSLTNESVTKNYHWKLTSIRSSTIKHGLTLGLTLYMLIAKFLFSYWKIPPFDMAYFDFCGFYVWFFLFHCFKIQLKTFLIFPGY